MLISKAPRRRKRVKSALQAETHHAEVVEARSFGGEEIDKSEVQRFAGKAFHQTTLRWRLLPSQTFSKLEMLSVTLPPDDIRSESYAEAAFLEKWKFSAGFEKGAPWPKALPVNLNGAHYTACCDCCAWHVSA